ncbi:MAG: UDP-N-acetylglucosamine diphosphorylase/glucosamine-phosphate N-acetyltransferase [Pseudomonadota bacterium]
MGLPSDCQAIAVQTTLPATLHDTLFASPDLENVLLMNIVILAAGMGKRMQSDLPKVLHALAGKALLHHVIDSAQQLCQQLPQHKLVVVVGHGGNAVPDYLAAQKLDASVALQAQQLGTGHAVLQALPQLALDQPTLILYGDVPLTRVTTLQGLLAVAGADKLGVLTMEVQDPTGLGRMVRENGKIVRIVEQKDASPAELALREINTGIMVAPTRMLAQWLAALSNQNAQGEYYLTDIVAQAVQAGVPVVSSQAEFEWEILGVNSKVQLAQLERIHQANLAQQLLQQGVTLADPARIDIRGQLRCGRDVFIDVGCVFEGEVELADGVQLGAYCVLRNAKVGAGSDIKPFCHIEQAEVGPHNAIGPYARLRPGTVLADKVHVGNFVEIKNSQVASGSKANHLSYIGDASVGARVNIGAGTITCNYDGVNKFRTIIEDDVFIGSDTQLVAPVTVERGATIGAGTTLVSRAPAEKLTLSRARQMTIDTWQRPQKKK